MLISGFQPQVHRLMQVHRHKHDEDTVLDNIQSRFLCGPILKFSFFFLNN